MVNRLEIRKNGESILDKISSMELRYLEIKDVFKSKDPDIIYINYLDELEFIIKKLDMIIGITTKKEAKTFSKNLIKTIKKYIKDENLEEYRIKSDVVDELAYLTSSGANITRYHILFSITGLKLLIRITHKDRLDMGGKDLVYYSRLGSNRRNPKEESRRNENTGRELIEYLFEYVLASYERTKLPFDFYEKIMILSILEDIRLMV